MKIILFYQNLFEFSLGIRKSFIPRFKGISRRLYNSLAKRHRKNGRTNIYIKLVVEGKYLIVNTTHQFPFTISQNKLYSTNLPRLCKYVSEKYPAVTVIDVGANIGDTVFLIKQEVDCEILSIEGNKDYISLLECNNKQYKNVATENCLVGSEDGKEVVKAISDGFGTTYFIREEGEGVETKGAEFKTLETIISSYPKFKDFKILKIDTDGYDCEIIRGNINYIAVKRPIIFFEYAPPWLPNGKDSEISIFSDMCNIGYEHFIFYSGQGELLYSISKDENFIHNIIVAHQFIARGRRFGDVIAFSKYDKDLFLNTLSSEFKFMRN